jgi:curli biogenesis system outer membrane secretion channel CsgG
MKNTVSGIILFLSFCIGNDNLVAQDILKIGILPIKYGDNEDSKDAAGQVTDQLYDRFTQSKQAELVEREFFKDLTDEKFLNSAVDFIEGDVVSKTKSAGAKYLLLGKISTCRVEESTGKSLTGGITQNYTCFLTIGLRLIDVETGIVAHSFTLENKKPLGISFNFPNRAAAVRSAVKNLEKDIKTFTDTYFPKEAAVKGILEFDKKNEKAEKIEVRIGNAHGAKVRDRFVVKEKYMEDDEYNYREVGEIEIIEVNGNKLSTAKVRSGGDKIKEKLEKGSILVVVTK